MNTSHTLEQMQQLRFQGMYQAYRSQLELPLNQQLEGHDLLAHLLQAEELNRSNERQPITLSWPGCDYPLLLSK